MFTFVFISIVNMVIWEVQIYVQHAFKDHCRYIKWQLVNCLFTYMIFFVRLLSVFLKHKMNTTFIMVLYLYRGAAPSITQGTFFVRKDVLICQTVQTCGSLLPSVRLHFNIGLYSPKCLVSVFPCIWASLHNTSKKTT